MITFGECIVACLVCAGHRRVGENFQLNDAAASWQLPFRHVCVYLYVGLCLCEEEKRDFVVNGQAVRRQCVSAGGVFRLAAWKLDTSCELRDASVPYSEFSRTSHLAIRIPQPKVRTIVPWSGI